MAVRFKKKSKVWFVDIRFDHTKRFRRNSPENSRAGAIAYEAMLRQKLARGESIERIHDTQQTTTLAQFAEKWFEQYVLPNNKQQEQRSKRYKLDAYIIPCFGKMPVEKISAQNIEQWKASLLKRGLSPKTVNNHLAVLRILLRMAYEWLEIKGVPPKIAPLKCPPPQTIYLSPDECVLFLSNAEGVVRDMILLALNTGMRQGELRALQWSSINWENRTITVRHSLNDRIKKLESPKSNRERHIPMDSYVYEMLFNRKKDTGYVFLNEDGRPFDSQRLIRRLNTVREKAGLKKFTWHSLRHTFATLIATKGGALHALQALLGHSTITMTMRYAHPDASSLRSTIDLLDPKSALNASSGHPVGTEWSQTTQQEIEKP